MGNRDRSFKGFTPPTAAPPGRDEAHVWAVGLDRSPTELSTLRGLLSEEERLRADRFVFPADRNRFVAGRGCLRAILSTYLGSNSRQIDLVQGPAGKPSLAPNTAAFHLEFNLSHSENRALIGISGSSQIGVDIERLRIIENAQELAERFFSPREADCFAELTPDKRVEAFLNLWTRKEALLKATGEGIAHSLHRIEVSFKPGEEACVISVPPEWGKATNWTLAALREIPGFCAAVAVWAPGVVIRWYNIDRLEALLTYSKEIAAS